MWQRIALSFEFSKIASNLNVSVGTVHNVFKHFQATGEVTADLMTARRQHKLDEHHQIYIIGLILNDSTLHLSELAEKVEEMTGTTVSLSTLCRLLSSHGLTRKKIQYVALQRRLDLRALFMAWIYVFNRNMFV